MLQRPLRKAKRSLVRKAKQPLVDKFNNPFHKFRQDFSESKTRKIYQSISLRKYLFLNRELESGYNYSKEPLSQRDLRFYIGSRKEIHYRNIDSIGRFIGLGGRIIPRRVTKLTLRHQRLMTRAIKKARFLALLPFIENELHFEKKWRDILARRRKKKDKKKNRNKRRSIPRVPKEGTETKETAPKTEPEINPWNRPWTRPFEGFKANPPRVGGTGTQETAPKTEPRVPKGGTKPGTSPFKNEGFKRNPKTESSSYRNRTRD
jgi:small subunit ribosomal protein S18